MAKSCGSGPNCSGRTVGAAEFARICTEANRLLNSRLAKENYGDTRSELVSVLVPLVGRLEPGEAARMCAEGARSLIQALARETNGDTRSRLAQDLAVVAEQLEPAEGARLLNQALAEENDRGIRSQLAAALVAVARGWSRPRPHKCSTRR